jgi:hypothetical protein
LDEGGAAPRRWALKSLKKKRMKNVAFLAVSTAPKTGSPPQVVCVVACAGQRVTAPPRAPLPPA